MIDIPKSLFNEKIGFPSLKAVKIENCPKLKEFIFNDKVAVPNIERLTIWDMDNLEKIWQDQLTLTLIQLYNNPTKKRILQKTMVLLLVTISKLTRNRYNSPTKKPYNSPTKKRMKTTALLLVTIWSEDPFACWPTVSATGYRQESIGVTNPPSERW
ncbi:hypothetical protein QYF36_014926 [Acer negundo]|nr:hypothetical protein QYF36_014926 [Acer negundo]